MPELDTAQPIARNDMNEDAKYPSDSERAWYPYGHEIPVRGVGSRQDWEAMGTSRRICWNQGCPELPSALRIDGRARDALASGRRFVGIGLDRFDEDEDRVKNFVCAGEIDAYLLRIGGSNLRIVDWGEGTGACRFCPGTNLR